MGDIDPQSSTLYEVENMSDSDWLDISSRESEVSDIPESDADDPFSRPHSPHSSSGSSDHNDEPDRWEGIIEPEDGDGVQSDHGHVDEALTSPPGGDAQSTLRFRDVARHRLVEELREREALEQSMISTLSTSRNSSLSASASTSAARSRDLRLSFPDPLTSSRDELNRSYDNVEIDESPSSSPAPPPFGDAEPTVANARVRVRAVAPEVPQPQPAPQPDLQVVLYGSQPTDKFRLVESLLDKLAVGSGLFLSKRQPSTPRVSNYVLDGMNKPFASVFTVQVVDNTEDEEVLVSVSVLLDRTTDLQLSQPISGELPSLAIIFLPHLLAALPRHTLYLPVVETRREFTDVSDSNEGFSADLLRRGVDRQWDVLRTPTSQTLLWHVDTPTVVMSEDEIIALDPAEVALGFEPLIPRRRRFVNVLRAQIASAPAMTLYACFPSLCFHSDQSSFSLAILSIVLGYIVSMSTPVMVPVEREVVSAVIKAFTHSANLSSVAMASSTPTSVEQPMPIMSTLPSSLSTAALSLQEQPPASLTPVVKPHVNAEASKFPNPSTYCPVTHSLALTSTKSLSVAPSTSKAVTIPRKAVFDLSTHFAGSIQDLFSPRVLIAAVRADMKELLDALDELLQVLSASAHTTLDMSLSVANNLRDQLRRRHRRAQDRARRLRAKGSQAWTDASKHVSERMEVARRRAKAIQAHIGDEAQAIVKRVRQRWDERRLVAA
ncbi:hypothetical protein K488DRAFT_84829 [Vararia minispora EC-137]|uniref:Uncharacterized protein n=1 Tax=Vararia minispora EC-137 TaxID=1314806 RepID=A0ACB8QNW4_9AGAM|nr:hypothetical protein K488DRAFT_84829 [Vararia minispora EC-137]